MKSHCRYCSTFFFFNDTATTEIYTLSLHDALPILPTPGARPGVSLSLTGLSMHSAARLDTLGTEQAYVVDRKSTRLNSSHSQISYAVFCLKKKKKQKQNLSCHKYNLANRESRRKHR